MVLYCDFEASQSSTMGVDLPGVAAKHNVTGFCIKPVTRSELPQLDTITYSGENAIEKFFEEITKFSYHMNEMYQEYGQEKMIFLDRKSQEYRNHWKAKKCWICKEKITCKASKLIFAHLKILKKNCSSAFREFMDARHSASVEEDDDDDDCGEDVAINLEEKDEIWMLGPKVETFI